MAIKIGHASKNEFGKAVNGVAGDSTKKEVCIRTWYNGSWDYVLRPRTQEIAEKSAQFVENICNNDNVGYDQEQRNSLFRQAQKVNFDCSKIVVKCECDCSSLIHVAVIAAGVNIAYGSNAFTTRNMADKLIDSGKYQKLTATKYLSDDKYLKRGDILVNKGKHTVMVLENGAHEETLATSATKKGNDYMFNPDTVKKGSEGKSVLLLQTMLKGKGYKGKNNKELGLDGKCGGNSEYAINAYQSDRRKKGVELGTNGKNDGSCGPKMWADLIGLPNLS